MKRCTEGLKSTRPKATHTCERMGSPTSSHQPLICARSASLRSRASSKMSYVSKPIFLACRMPSSMSTPVPIQVELIIPSSSCAICSLPYPVISSMRTRRFSSSER